MEFLSNSSSKEIHRLIHSHSLLLNQNSLNDLKSVDKEIYLNSIGHFLCKYEDFDVDDSNLKMLIYRYQNILAEEPDNKTSNNVNDKTVIIDNTKIIKERKFNNTSEYKKPNHNLEKSHKNQHIDDNSDNINNVVTSDRIQELLQMQQDTFQSEMDQEHNLQQEITSDLCTLTDMLRETTIRMQENIRKQNMDLVEIQQEASENVELLAEQQSRMNKKHDEMSMSFYSTLVLIVSSLGLFILTFIVIRLFPKPTS